MYAFHVSSPSHHQADKNSVCGASALRLSHSSRKSKSDDKTYWLALVGLCGSVEIAMVILCGCFASFSRFLKWVKGERTESQRRGSQQCVSRSYRSESQSRLEHDAFVELGTFDFEDAFEVVAEDRKTLG